MFPFSQGNNILRIYICLIASVTSLSVHSQELDSDLQAVQAKICTDHDLDNRAITAEDMLWLARMIHGETGGKPTVEDADAMLWSLIQRYTIPNLNKRYESLADFSQAYSQPINPKWLKSGKGCKKNPAACSEKRLQKRLRDRNREWEDLHLNAQDSVLALVSGDLENIYPGVIGWFETATWERRAAKNMDDGSKKGEPRKIFAEKIEKNVFYYQQYRQGNTQDWTVETVRVVPEYESC